MRLVRLVAAYCLFPLIVLAADDITPLSPAEAAKKVHQQVVVVMEVKSTGGSGNRYLNSEANFKDAANFTICIPKDRLEQFKQAGIEDVDKYYQGRRIQVTGTVILKSDKPRIEVDAPQQISIVEQEGKK